MPSTTLEAGTHIDAPTTTLEALPRLSHRVARGAVDVSEAQPGHHLAVEDGGARRLVALNDHITHLGRSFTSHLRFDDTSVSRTHAIIVRRRGGARILDDRSANGTFVNGRRITSADLADGDVIVLGQVVLTFLEVC
jgi:pSer/pThr/pTyr-binding forkhead associated (FHA) protein